MFEEPSAVFIIVLGGLILTDIFGEAILRLLLYIVAVPVVITLLLVFVVSHSVSHLISVKAGEEDV